MQYNIGLIGHSQTYKFIHCVVSRSSVQPSKVCPPNRFWAHGGLRRAKQITSVCLIYFREASHDNSAQSILIAWWSLFLIENSEWFAVRRVSGLYSLKKTLAVVAVGCLLAGSHIKIAPRRDTMIVHSSSTACAFVFICPSVGILFF